MSTNEKPIVLKRLRKPKARATAIIIGALDENARILLRDPHSESIGERISDLLDELQRSLGRPENEDSE